VVVGMAALSQLCCLRRPESLRLYKVKPITVAIYKKALAEFVAWLEQVNLVPAGVTEWDDAVVLFCREQRWSAGKMHQLVNGLELCFPRFKRQFSVARAEADGLQALTPIEHKIPMTRGPASLYAAHASACSRFRLGVGLIVQQGAGLRPSELLGLLPEHAQQRDTLFGASYCLRLGALVGTKSRREQVTFIYQSEDPHAFELLARVVSVTPIGQKLFPFSYSSYNNFLRETSKHFDVKLDFTAHSPRAGFASERIARGEAEVDVQRRGRWKVASSFSIYVDVILASQVEVHFELRGLSEAMVFCNFKLLDYFPADLLGADHGSEKGRKAVRHARATFGQGGSTGSAREGSHQAHQEDGQTASASANRGALVAFDFLGPAISAARGRTASSAAASGVRTSGAGGSAAAASSAVAAEPGGASPESQSQSKGREKGGQPSKRMLRMPTRR
jgi:integrase